MAIVFDPTQFKLDYPQFVSLTNENLTNLFNYNALKKSGWVDNYLDWADNDKYYWQCVMLAHICTVLYGADGSGSQVLGRINSADTGRVSLSFTNMTPLNEFRDELSKTVYGQMILGMMEQLPICDYVC